MRSKNRSHSWWRKIHRNYKVRRYRPKIWVLPQLDLGYIKITKVASTSIELALSQWLFQQETGEPAGNLDRQQVKDYSGTYSHHFDPEKMHGSLKPGFVFSFVRNPLERLHSSYVNKILDVRERGESHNIFWNHDITLDMSFDEFVRKVAAIPDQAIDRHLRSQSSCLYTGGTPIADQVGKIENLSSEWQLVADRFGLPPIPHQNRSTREQGPSPFNRATAEIAAERYQEDIRNFGYGGEVADLINSL